MQRKSRFCNTKVSNSGVQVSFTKLAIRFFPQIFHLQRLPRHTSISNALFPQLLKKVKVYANAHSQDLFSRFYIVKTLVLYILLKETIYA